MATLNLEVSGVDVEDVNGLYVSKDIARMIRAVLLEALRSAHAARGRPPLVDLLSESKN